MQKAVFPINSHADITKAINYMHTNYTRAINEGKPLRVVIDQKQDDRSTAQNRLMWMWLGQIEKKTGFHMTLMDMTPKVMAACTIMGIS